MRADIEGALIPVKWAEAQIPILQERFRAWQQSNPYEMVMEPDPDGADWELLCAYLRKPLTACIIGDVGAIINSTDTALDILMTAIVRSRTQVMRRTPNFPVRDTAADFLGTVNALKAPHRLSRSEIAAIKRAKAYKRREGLIWAIRELDNMRKHERPLQLHAGPGQAHITLINGASYARRRVLQDKTILFRIPARARFRPSPSNTLVASEIFLNEAASVATKEPAITILRRFIGAVRALIEGFP
jgi:hypothetical protein